MSRVTISLSVIFSIFCLSSFRLIDDEQPIGAKLTKNEAVESVASVCADQMFEYFYTSSDRFINYCDTIYSTVFSDSNRPSRKVFNYAMKGLAYSVSKDMVSKKNILAFIDYSLSSNVKRMWVVDLRQMKLMFHELVAHGRNSGNEYARKFSNVHSSFQTSLGFYITGEIYDGKHNTSIKMNGMEYKYNSKAFDRGIVIHGADYVSEKYIENNQRLGRSLGCPAVSENVIQDLASVISDGVCLFAYYPNKTYLRTSKFLNSNVIFSKEVNSQEINSL
jgi:hypothetical protein